jgi:hypothetical protein
MTRVGFAFGLGAGALGLISALLAAWARLTPLAVLGVVVTFMGALVVALARSSAAKPSGLSRSRFIFFTVVMLCATATGIGVCVGGKQSNRVIGGVLAVVAVSTWFVVFITDRKRHEVPS